VTQSYSATNLGFRASGVGVRGSGFFPATNRYGVLVEGCSRLGLKGLKGLKGVVEGSC